MSVIVGAVFVFVSIHLVNTLECKEENAVIVLKKGDKKEISFWTDSSPVILVKNITTPSNSSSLGNTKSVSTPQGKTPVHKDSKTSDPLHNLLMIQNLYGNVPHNYNRPHSDDTLKIKIPQRTEDGQHQKKPTKTPLEASTPTISTKKPSGLLVYIPGDVFLSHIKKLNTPKPKPAYPTFIIKPTRTSSKFSSKNKIPLLFPNNMTGNEVTVLDLTPTRNKQPSGSGILSDNKTSLLTSNVTQNNSLIVEKQTLPSTSPSSLFLSSTQSPQYPDKTTPVSYIGEPTIKNDVFNFPPSRASSVAPSGNSNTLVSFDKVIQSVKSVINSSDSTPATPLPSVPNINDILGLKNRPLFEKLPPHTEVVHADDVESSDSTEDEYPEYIDLHISNGSLENQEISNLIKQENKGPSVPIALNNGGSEVQGTSESQMDKGQNDIKPNDSVVKNVGDNSSHKPLGNTEDESIAPLKGATLEAPLTIEYNERTEFPENYNEITTLAFKSEEVEAVTIHDSLDLVQTPSDTTIMTKIDAMTISSNDDDDDMDIMTTPDSSQDMDSRTPTEEFPPKLVVIDKIDDDVILIREEVNEDADLEVTTLFFEEKSQEFVQVNETDTKVNQTNSGDLQEVETDLTGRPIMTSLYESTVMNDAGIVGNVLKGNELDKHISSVFVNDFNDTIGIVVKPETLMTMGAVVSNSSMSSEGSSSLLLTGIGQKMGSNIMYPSTNIILPTEGNLIDTDSKNENWGTSMNVAINLDDTSVSYEEGGENVTISSRNNTSPSNYSNNYLSDLKVGVTNVDNNGLFEEEGTTSIPEIDWPKITPNRSVTWLWNSKNPFITGDNVLQNVPSNVGPLITSEDSPTHGSPQNQHGSVMTNKPLQYIPPLNMTEGSNHILNINHPFPFPHGHLSYHQIPGYPISYPHGYFPPQFPPPPQGIATITKVDINGISPHSTDNKFGVPHEVGSGFRPVFPQYGFQPPRHPVQAFNVSNSFGGFTFKPEQMKRPDPVSSLPIADPVFLVFESLRNKYKIKSSYSEDSSTKTELSSPQQEVNRIDHLDNQETKPFSNELSEQPDRDEVENSGPERVGSDEYVLDGIYKVLHDVTSHEGNEASAGISDVDSSGSLSTRSKIAVGLPSHNEETLVIRKPDPFFEIPAPDLAQERPEDLEQFLRKVEESVTSEVPKFGHDSSLGEHEAGPSVQSEVQSLGFMKDSLEMNDFLNSIPSYQFSSLRATSVNTFESDIPQYVPFDITPNPPKPTTSSPVDTMVTTTPTISSVEFGYSDDNSTKYEPFNSALIDAEASLRALDANFFRFLDSQSDVFRESFLSLKAEPRELTETTNTTSLPLNCQWTVKSSPNMYLLLTFKNLSAPHTIDCMGAYIEVERENNGFTARWCGNKLNESEIKRPQVILARGEVKITVFDRGDHVISSPTGFEALLEVMDLKERETRDTKIWATSNPTQFSDR